MFERYTERARRVLFFARYEASQLGSISIEKIVVQQIQVVVEFEVECIPVSR